MMITSGSTIRQLRNDNNTACSRSRRHSGEEWWIQTMMISYSLIGPTGSATWQLRTETSTTAAAKRMAGIAKESGINDTSVGTKSFASVLVGSWPVDCWAVDSSVHLKVNWLVHWMAHGGISCGKVGSRDG